MTTTLIAVITSFIVLVTPSEVVHFLYYAVVDDTWQSFSVVMVMANALQTVSFAVNFVLYFVLNRQFRRALSEARYCCGYCRDRPHRTHYCIGCCAIEFHLRSKRNCLFCRDDE